MTEIKAGDRVVLATSRSWRTDLPGHTPGTVLAVEAVPVRSLESALGGSQDFEGMEDFAVVRWDEPYNPPCGYDQIPASWLIPIEDEIPADWLEAGS